jgi:hypothetical protein
MNLGWQYDVMIVVVASSKFVAEVGSILQFQSEVVLLSSCVFCLSRLKFFNEDM